MFYMEGIFMFIMNNLFGNQSPVIVEPGKEACTVPVIDWPSILIRPHHIWLVGID